MLESHLAVDLKRQEQSSSVLSSYRCDLCNLEAPSYNYLKQHVNQHMGFGANLKFTCGICKDNFDTKLQLKKHSTLHDNFSCFDCYRRFPTSYKLKKHRRTRICEPADRFVRCEKCDEKYMSAAQLQLHRCSTNKEEKLVCPVCHKKLDNMYRVRIHLNIHTGERPYTCYTCGDSFGDPRNLTDHQLLHWDAKNYRCEKCGARFKQRSGLKSHRIKHRVIEGNQNKTDVDEKDQPNLSKCEICGKFVSRLDSHVRVHTGEKPYTCDTCGRKFAQSSTLSKHMQTHSTSREVFPCKYCPKVLKNRRTLQLHEKNHIGQHKCDMCYSQFASQASLKAHMESHSDDMLICPTCGKDFKRKVMVSHIKTHDDTVYGCSLCDKTFKHEKSLKGHMDSHTGYRPFICGHQGCNKTFVKKGYLLQHAKAVHGAALS